MMDGRFLLVPNKKGKKTQTLSVCLQPSLEVDQRNTTSGLNCCEPAPVNKTPVGDVSQFLEMRLLPPNKQPPEWRRDMASKFQAKPKRSSLGSVI